MRKMVYVYRVEDDKGDGPYTGKYWSGQDAMCEAHRCCSRHPVAYWMWKPNHITSDMLFCGFESLEKLRAWFEPKHLANMKKAGFVVNKYRIDNHWLVSDNYQVSFVRCRASKVRTMSWNYLTRAKKQVELVS